MRDKPGKPVDFYHTCYCLSGLGATQHGSAPGAPHSSKPKARAGGGQRGALRASDPVCNVLVERLAEARAYFCAQPPVPV